MILNDFISAGCQQRFCVEWVPYQGFIWLRMVTSFMFRETEEGDVIDFLERRRVVAAKIFIVKMRPVRTKHFAHPGSISRNPFQLCASLATFHVQAFGGPCGSMTIIYPCLTC